jgi:TIR domain
VTEFSYEDELREYLTAHAAPNTVEQGRLSDICRFSYLTEETRQEACAALTQFLKIAWGLPCETIPEVAGFLEASHYTPAYQWLIKHRNALQADIEKGCYVGDDARESLAALNNAVTTLRSATSTPPAPVEHAKKRYHVFLSYSSQDDAAARRLVQEIEAAGFKVYFAPKDLRAGDAFTDEIRRALHESQELWLLASPNSLRSEWVLTEWGAAWALAKRTIPILFRCSPADLPSRLASLHCIDYHDIQALLNELKTRTSA